jgi:hypothetical protein
MAKRDVQLDIKVSGENQINNVNKALEKTSVDAAKVAESTIKLTKGIAGGFELASQAAGLFGEETGKAFEKTVQRATEYIALSNALKDVAEGFSKENIKGLTGIFQGFTKAGIGAKLFGSTTRIAIAATGIGALVVGIGLLAANWDAVTEAVGGFIDSIPFLKSIKDTINELIDKVGSLGNLFQAVGAYITAVFTSGADASEAFNKSLEDSKAADALDEKLKAQEKINKELDRSIELLKAQGGEEQKIFDLRRKNLNENIRLQEELAKTDEKAIEALEDYKQALKLLDIEEKKFRLTQQQASLKAIQDANNEAKAKLENERKALEEREKTQLAIERELQDQRLKLINNEEERALKVRAESTVRFIEDTTKKYEEGKKKNLITEKQYNELIENEQKLLERDLDKIVSDARKKRDIEEQQNILKSIERSKKFVQQLVDGTVESLKDYNPIFFIKAELEDVYKGIQKINDKGLRADKIEEFNDSVKELNKDLIKSGNAVVQGVQGGFDILTKESIKFFKEEYPEIYAAFREQQKIENAELFQEISAYAGLAAELIDSLFSRQSFLIQQNLNQIAVDTERVNNQYTEAVNSQRALEDELLTAQGARREEILNSLDRERNKEKQLAAEREKLRRAEIDQKNKQQQIEYRNAVVQSTIAAAQAVLAALATTPPASFAFAAVAAAISAIQTGIVAANKPTPLTYASGGYTPTGIGAPDSTGEKPVNAQLHEKEWVAPRWMVESDRFGSIISQLEGARKGSFAQGGFSTPVITDNTGNGSSSLIAALQGLNLSVSVVEVNEVQSRVNVIENRASL